MRMIPRFRWSNLPLLIFAAVSIAAIFLPYDPGSDETTTRLLLPSLDHPLGTDRLGRDILHRLILATRGFFLPGLLAASITLILGTTLGAIGGYVPETGSITSMRGWKRRVLDGVRNVVGVVLALPAALPRFVSILLVCSAFGFEPMVLGAAVGILYAAELGADLKRRVSLCCGEEYVEAAQAEGLSTFRILAYHIVFLHCRALIVRHLVYVWSFCILVETSMSYIPGEFGIQEPNPSWGNMLLGDSDAAMQGHIWAALVPTIAIVSAIVLLARTGDRLSDQDAVDEESTA